MSISAPFTERPGQVIRPRARVRTLMNHLTGALFMQHASERADWPAPCQGQAGASSGPKTLEHLDVKHRACPRLPAAGPHHFSYRLHESGASGTATQEDIRWRITPTWRTGPPSLPWHLAHLVPLSLQAQLAWHSLGCSAFFSGQRDAGGSIAHVSFSSHLL